MSNDLLKDFGAHFQKLRIEAGYEDQKEFAEALGVQPSTISMYENGRRLPKYIYWKKILKLLKCESLDILFKLIIGKLEDKDEMSTLIDHVRKIYKISGARNELYHQIDIIKRLYHLEKKLSQPLIQGKQLEV